MKTTIFAVTCVALISGCATTSDQNAEFSYDNLRHKQIEIILVPMRNVESVDSKYRSVVKRKNVIGRAKLTVFLTPMKAFSVWNKTNNRCIVYYVLGDDWSQAHEIDHCLWGEYH